MTAEPELRSWPTEAALPAATWLHRPVPRDIEDAFLDGPQVGRVFRVVSFIVIQAEYRRSHWPRAYVLLLLWGEPHISDAARALVRQLLTYARIDDAAACAVLADMLEETGHPAAAQGTYLFDLRQRYQRRKHEQL